MVDPLSVIALGITVSQGFLAALSSWRSFEGDIQEADKQIEDLNQTLRILSSHIASHPLSEVDTHLVNGNVLGCQDGIKTLQAALVKVQGLRLEGGEVVEFRRKLQHLLFPLKKNGFKALRDVVSDLQQRLALALHVYQM